MIFETGERRLQRDLPWVNTIAWYTAPGLRAPGILLAQRAQAPCLERLKTQFREEDRARETWKAAVPVRGM